MRVTNRPLTVAALLLSMFMAAMEATVVGTAMPTVISELGGLALYGWVGSAYLLTGTVSVPLYGKLADLYGRKPIVLIGIALFLGGSVASGFAGSIGALIVARAVQGLGAGAMQPIALTIIGDIFTIEERGRIQGFFGAVWGIAGVSGPLVGGALVHALSWRWVFWINVPFGIASAAVLMMSYREQRARTQVSIDWVGAAVLTGASLCLLLGVGRELPAVTLPAALGLGLLFIWVERRAKDPVVPLDMVMRRPIFVASLSATLLGAAMTAAVMFVPLYVQGVLGGTPTEAGSTIAPMLVGWPIASAITSRMLVRTGFRAPIWLGSVVVAATLVTFALQIGAHASVIAMQATMFVYGLGMGLANTALLIAVQSSVAYGQRGVATAASMFARSMGGAIGVGALGAVLAATLGAGLRPEVVRTLLDADHRAHGAHALDPSVIGVLAAGLAPVFWTTAALAVVNLVVVAFYPHHAASEAVQDPAPSS